MRDKNRSGCGNCPKKKKALEEIMTFIIYYFYKGKGVGYAARKAGISIETGRNYKKKFEEILKNRH
jgi:transposase